MMGVMLCLGVWFVVGDGVEFCVWVLDVRMMVLCLNGM